MFNFRDSHTSLERTKTVATGSTVTAEGVVLVGVLENGVEVAKMATGAASEKVLGFAKLDNETLTFGAKVEEVTIPATSPYTVTLSHGSLQGSGPSSYSVRVDNAGSDMTQDGSIGHPATTEFKVSDAAAGELTFNSAQAGDTVTVYYRYDLTAVEATQVLPGVRSINNGGSAALGQVTVMGGVGEVYTHEYDVTADFSTGTLKTLANGVVTMGGSGTDLAALGWVVIKLPDTNDPALGLRILTAL